MAESKAIAARVHPDVHEWLKEQAETDGTTLGSKVEDILRGYYQSHQVESDDPSEWSEPEVEQLPEAVYTPDSREYDYAIRLRDRDGSTDTKYYKTKQGLLKAIDRLKESERWEVRA